PPRRPPRFLLPPPQAGEGEERAQAGEGKESAARRYTNTSPLAQCTSLTARARALYEDTVVPVREIARFCGVTERTILKYARKGNWKPRYHWIAGEAGVRHRRWQPAEKFAPVKGAGARFIAREDAGKPFAVGLKATDPQGAARAAEECVQAEELAAQAQADAARERLKDKALAALEAVSKAIADINDYRRKRARQAERDARFEQAALPREGHFVWRDGMQVIVRPEREARAAARAVRDANAQRAENLMWVAVAIKLSQWEATLAALEGDTPAPI
ncbi:MAG TPA: hypothetical protein VM867_09710, partial [Xanthobacteraceae bacterium]|nr:hypothetical protein [Xanthobacteraceae bacterium]